jgi:hypothetical protein
MSGISCKTVYKEEDRWVTTEITVPEFLNDGSPTPNEVFDFIDRELTEVFGGYSMREDVYGVWVDPSTGIREDMINKVYVITYDLDLDPYATEYLEELAREVGDMMEQQSMYTVTYGLQTKTPFIEVSPS